MITVAIEKRYGAATVHARVSAPTIERAVEIAGPGTPEGCVTRVRFPIEGETFFVPEGGRPVVAEGVDYGAMTHEQVEEAYEAPVSPAPTRPTSTSSGTTSGRRPSKPTPPKTASPKEAGPKGANRKRPPTERREP